MRTIKWLQLVILFLMGFGISSCNSQTKEQSKSIKVESQKKDNTMNTKEIIVDVRTPEEWEFDGHAECSVNYPLDEIQGKIDELKKYEHVVLVCRSGNRAGMAKRMLEGAGIKNVENLGPWQNVACAN